MSRGNVNTGLLRKTAVWSYIMGIWQFLSVIVLVVAVFLMIFPLMSVMGPLPTPSLVAVLYQIVDSLFLALAIVSVVTALIMLVFGIYAYKVGAMYSLGSLKLTGASAIVMVLGYPLLIYGMYQFRGTLLAMLPTPPPEYATLILSSVSLFLMGAAVVGLFGFIFYIAFIVAASGMKTRTGISEFNTAMWLGIVGLFTGILFPVALILFGLGLSRLGKVVETGPARTTVEREAPKGPPKRETMYCPYCGAKVEAGALFCQSCGSSLQKDQ